jgi:hypothetical protein
MQKTIGRVKNEPSDFAIINKLTFQTAHQGYCHAVYNSDKHTAHNAERINGYAAKYAYHSEKYNKKHGQKYLNKKFSALDYRKLFRKDSGFKPVSVNNAVENLHYRHWNANAQKHRYNFIHLNSPNMAVKSIGLGEN